MFYVWCVVVFLGGGFLFSLALPHNIDDRSDPCPICGAVCKRPWEHYRQYEEGR